MNKVFASVAEAVADMTDGISLMSGGFGLSGNPEKLIAAIRDLNIKDLDIISNN